MVSQLDHGYIEIHQKTWLDHWWSPYGENILGALPYLPSLPGRSVYPVYLTCRLEGLLRGHPPSRLALGCRLRCGAIADIGSVASRAGVTIWRRRFPNTKALPGVAELWIAQHLNIFKRSGWSVVANCSASFCNDLGFVTGGLDGLWSPLPLIWPYALTLAYDVQYIGPRRILVDHVQCSVSQRHITVRTWDIFTNCLL